MELKGANCSKCSKPYSVERVHYCSNCLKQYHDRISELEAEVERLKRMGKTYLKQLHQAAKVEVRLVAALKKVTVSDKVIEQAKGGE